MKGILEAKKLNELLNVRKILEEDGFSIDRIFECIAMKLFREYHIQKGKDRYDFLEIEFYYYAQGHEDIITYPRRVEKGKWYFHASGVDISFESVCADINKSCKERTPGNDYFGGILIRSLLKDNEIINGPQRCLWRLFDFMDVFELVKDEIPLLNKNDSKKDTGNMKIMSCLRHIPVSEDRAKERFGNNSNVFLEFKNQKKYRYYLEHSCWQDVKKSKYKAKEW